MKTVTLNKVNKLAAHTMAIAVAFGLGACGDMSPRDKNTAVGAAAGAVGGAILTGGSTAGTVGGAAVGGVIGNQVDKNKQ